MAYGRWALLPILIIRILLVSARDFKNPAPEEGCGYFDQSGWIWTRSPFDQLVEDRPFERLYDWDKLGPYFAKGSFRITVDMGAVLSPYDHSVQWTTYLWYTSRVERWEAASSIDGVTWSSHGYVEFPTGQNVANVFVFPAVSMRYFQFDYIGGSRGDKSWSIRELVVSACPPLLTGAPPTNATTTNGTNGTVRDANVSPGVEPEQPEPEGLPEVVQVGLHLELTGETSVTKCLKPKASHCRGKTVHFRKAGELPVRLGAIYPYPVDFDGDGDVDLLIGRSTGELVYVPNTNSYLDVSAAIGISRVTATGEPCKQTSVSLRCSHWCCSGEQSFDQCETPSGLQECSKTSAFGVNLSSALIPVAVDWNGDSIIDIVAGSCDGTIHYFAGRGGMTFEKLVGAENPFDGINYGYSGRTPPCAAPEIVDWDSDGDLDLILGVRLFADSRAFFYENVHGTLRPMDYTENPLQHVPAIRLGSWVTLAAADIDGDGDVDLLAGGDGDKGILYFERTSHGSLEHRGMWDDNHDKHRIFFPRLADLNRDGNMDLLYWCNDDKWDGALAEHGLSFVLSEWSDELTEHADINPFTSIRDLKYIVPQVTSWYGDRRHNLLVTSREGSVDLYAASHDATVLPARSLLKFRESQRPVAHAVDWDMDGSVDLLVGLIGGQVLFHRRLPDDTLAPGVEILEKRDIDGSFVAPHAVDFNADGLVDLVLGDSGVVPENHTFENFKYEELPGTVRFFERVNVSTHGFVERFAASNPFQHIRGVSLLFPQVLDWDKDGHLDLVLGTTTFMMVPKLAGGGSSYDPLYIHSDSEKGIRYFQGSPRGLEERLQEQSPFYRIELKPWSVPTIVDWDYDGDLEVIVAKGSLSVNSHKLSYYKKGETCEAAGACSQRGFCKHVEGTCACAQGYTLSDCSRCAGSYFSEQTTAHLGVSACLPCPGVGTEAGTCAGRGVCFDDLIGRSLHGHSNTTYTPGSGACHCAKYFSGDCTEGMCPAGMELKLLAGEVVKQCLPCQPGQSKSVAGNGLCEACPVGLFAAESGAIACDACPSGKFQPRPGQDLCLLCDLGTASVGGSGECWECPIGKYADRVGLGECLACPPGTWSDAPGARECAPCPAGWFGSGLEACQSCERGSFSEMPGQGNCTLCYPGRYSGLLGASNEEACEPCAEGKYSSLSGQTQEASCLQCTPGATTLNRASTDITNCILPHLQNFRCASGHFCIIRVTGSGLRRNHHMVISAATNLYSNPSEGGEVYTWNMELKTGGGHFDLKWCPGVHSNCKFITDYKLLVGVLEVVGPYTTSPFTCVRGRSCLDLGPVTGLGLLGMNNKIWVVAGDCGGPKVRLHSAESGSAGLVVMNGNSFTFGFGDVPVAIEPGTGYQVCWCGTTSLAPGQCEEPQHFLTPVASLHIEGPKLGHEVECYLGQHCSIQDIDGVAIAPGDRLMVMSRCGPGGLPVLGLPGGSIADIGGQPTFEFLPLNDTGAKVLTSFAGMYRLCFCRSVESHMTCDSPADFAADVGLFTAQGPYSDHIFGCYLGDGCVLQGIRGIGLKDRDEVMVQVENCDQSRSMAAPGFPDGPTQALSNGADFALGLLTTAEPGHYHVCWRPADMVNATYGVSAGTIYVTCRPGQYRVGNGCEKCPRGHYCTGGSDKDFRDDIKERCFDAAATTKTTGARNPEECLCAPGQKKGTRRCQPCEIGRYKPDISNDESCPMLCPNGTTTLPGASSQEHCFSEIMSGEGHLDEAQVFVLEGSLALGISGCEMAEQRRASFSLRRLLSQILSIPESDVALANSLGDCPSAAADQSDPGGRRLLPDQFATLHVTFRVLRANQWEVDGLQQGFTFRELQYAMPEEVATVLGPASLFTISKETLKCQPHMAFLRGGRPTSLGECSCSLGHYMDQVEKTCQPCALGEYKASIGDDGCTLCPLAKHSGQEVLQLTTLQVGSVWEANCTCPAGYFTEAENFPMCHECPEGHYCTGGWHMQKCPDGSTTQTKRATSIEGCLCAKGRYADGDGKCSACPQGRWSDTLGAQECALCPAGKFGSGLQACQKCTAGSFSGQGQGSCTLCNPGRYSGQLGADTEDVCQLCAEGKFSSLRGQTQEASCLECIKGATTLTKGSTDNTTCIQPDPQDFRCTSGRYCKIRISGRGLRQNHHLAISVVNLLSNPSEGGEEYTWKSRLDFGGGTFPLKWCPGVHTDCTVINDFQFVLGVLEIAGPNAGPAVYTCVRGRACSNLGPVAGVGLSGINNNIQVFLGECGGDQVRLHSKPGSEGTVDARGGKFIFGFGNAAVVAEPSVSYSICWCGMQAEEPGSCSGSENFRTHVAPLRIEGPKPGHEVACHLGQHCSIQDVQGVNILPGDRLMVMDICGSGGQQVSGLPGGSIAETMGSSTFEFLPLNETGVKALESFAGIYRLCFCRAVASPMTCTSPADFNADVGLFTAMGPYPDHTFGCYVGSACTLHGIRGIGLRDENEVLVQVEECGQQAGKAAHGLPSSPTRASANGATFRLGLLMTAKPGRYYVCWRDGSRSESPFGTSAGRIYVTCPPGTYGFRDGCEECPLGHYCTGGNEEDYEDDLKERCFDAGATTRTTGANTSDDCLCARGQKKGLNRCEPCDTGRFKPDISNDESCPGICPNGTTSWPGASSLEHCHSKTFAEEERLDQAQVFVLEGNMNLGMQGCGEARRALVKLQLQELISRLLGVLGSEVAVEVADTWNCSESAAHSSSPGDRSLQVSQPSATHVAFRIRRADKQEVDRLKQSVNFAELQDELPPDVAVFLGQGNLSIVTEVLTCQGSMAFPRGSRPTSLGDCTCSYGHYMDEVDKKCKPCAEGDYKDSVGDEKCTQCGRQLLSRHGARLEVVQLTTLQIGTVQRKSCTCPAGFFTDAGDPSCQQCPSGHYCTGGHHIQMCPAGSTTQTNGTQSVDGCVCDRGQTTTVSRNATHRCQPCDEGKYKAGVGNLDCSEKCRPNSESAPGAASSADCFCRPGYFYVAATDTCDPCPAEGLTCPGGFDPPDSRRHAEPQSLEGFYMTGLATVEQCVVLDAEGKSVCLAGAKASNLTQACSGRQLGLLCGACEHLSARDSGDLVCQSCGEEQPDWFHVLGLNADLVLKAGFGIFLGKQAVNSATETTKMDAIVLRILLEWMTVCTALTEVDLSGVPVFEWSKEAMIKMELLTRRDVSGIHDVPVLNFKFQFPAWFVDGWRRLVALTLTIPSPKSPQESLECLVQRQLQPRHNGLPSRKQLLVPAIWWISYPFLVLVYVYLLCLLAAKVAFPVLQYFKGAGKRKLRKHLARHGVSEDTAEVAVDSLNETMVTEILHHPRTLTSLSGLINVAGPEVTAFVVSDLLLGNAGVDMQTMLQEVLELDDLDPRLVLAVEEALEDADAFRSLLTKVVAALDPKDVVDLCVDVPQAPSLLRSYLLDMSEDQLTGLQHGSGYVSQCQARRDPGTRPIFGLFQSSNAITVLRDAVPIFLVTLYSTWDVVTRRLLSLIQVKKVSLLDNRIEESRWPYDMRFQVFQGDHFAVACIGLAGLAVWSVGFLLLLCFTVHLHRHRLQEPKVLRKYGYFYIGLEPETYWWDMVTKRIDILCLYFVNFMDFFHDPRAKLTMYLGFAGIFWALHNVFNPFDDRQNRLADRLESRALALRFVTLFLLQCLLVTNAGWYTNVSSAVALLACNGAFLAVLLFILLVEMTEDISEAQDQAKSSLMMKGSDDMPLVRKMMLKLLNFFLSHLLRPVMNLLQRLGAILWRLRDTEERRVPYMLWQPGEGLVVLLPEGEAACLVGRPFSRLVRHIYGLHDESQRAFLAHLVGQFLNHLLTNSECQQLPSNILETFFSLPSALRKERKDEAEESEPKSMPYHIRVAKTLKSRKPFAVRPSNCNALALRTKSTLKRGDTAPESIFTAEELNAALLFLQRLSAREVCEFLVTACETEEAVEYKASTPGHSLSRATTALHGCTGDLGDESAVDTAAFWSGASFGEAIGSFEEGPICEEDSGTAEERPRLPRVSL